MLSKIILDTHIRGITTRITSHQNQPFLSHTPFYDCERQGPCANRRQPTSCGLGGGCWHVHSACVSQQLVQRSSRSELAKTRCEQCTQAASAACRTAAGALAARVCARSRRNVAAISFQRPPVSMPKTTKRQRRAWRTSGYVCLAKHPVAHQLRAVASRRA